jgi:hypothetical protein
MSNLPATMPERRPLPKVDDLYQDVELAAKHNELNRLLNCPPKPEWIRTNAFAQNSKYIPIGIIEYLLTSIFIQWRVEVKEVKLIANSIEVTVRLWMMNPITGEWDWQEGIGAAPLKTQKGAGAIEFDKILDSAVQTGAPAAKSYAVKDAAENLGKLFGKDLNRKDENTMNYGGLEAKLPVDRKTELPEELKTVISEADADSLVTLYKNNPEYHSVPAFMQLLAARQIELKAKKNAANTMPV